MKIIKLFENFNSLYNIDFPYGFKNIPENIHLYRIFGLTNDDNIDYNNLGKHYVADYNLLNDDDFLLSIGFSEDELDELNFQIVEIITNKDNIDFDETIKHRKESPNEYEFTIKSDSIDKIKILDYNNIYENLKIGDYTDAGLVTDITDTQVEIDNKMWFLKKILKKTSKLKDKTPLVNRGRISPHMVISAFSNPIDYNSIEYYKNKMMKNWIEKPETIKGYPTIIDKDDVGNKSFMDGRFVKESDIGKYAWIVTDGHHRTSAGIEIDIPYILTKLDPVYTADETDYIDINEGLIMSMDSKKLIKVLKRHITPDYYVEGPFGPNGDEITVRFNNKERVYNEKIKSIISTAGWYPSKLNSSRFVEHDDIIGTVMFKPKFESGILDSKSKKIFYHVAPSKYDYRIKKQGLKPSNNNKVDNYPGRIYMLDDIKYTKNIAMDLNRYDDNQKEYTVWKIRLNRNECTVYKDETVMFGHSYYIQGINISPNDIEKVKKIKLK